MSISPPSDLVLDVARAADPQKAGVASARLRGLGGGGAAASAFPALLDAAHPAGRPTMSAALAAPPQIPQQRHSSVATTKLTPHQALGRLVLQQAIEQMLPSSASSVYGQGFAGSVWRSMLAEQMAGAIAPSVFRNWRSAASDQGASAPENKNAGVRS